MIHLHETVSDKLRELVKFWIEAVLGIDIVKVENIPTSR